MSVNVGFCPYLSVNVLINMNRHSFLLSVIWGFCLGTHLLAVAKLPVSLSTSFIV